MTGLRLRPAASGEEWDRLAAAFPESTPFHAWRFLHDEARAGGWHFSPMVAERGGVAVGIVPIAAERGPLRRTPAMEHPYHGPLVSVEDFPELLVALRRERRRRRMARMTMSFSPDAPGERAAELSAAGWSIFVDHTYVVDLRSTIPVAQDQGATMPFVPSGHRRRVRRALAKGVVAQRVDRVDELLLTVMRQAFSAHGGQSRWTHDQLDRVNRLLDRGDAVALEAVHQDRRLGVVVRLRGGDRAFSWIGAVLPEGRPLAAATVLAHEHMRLAAAEGVLHFDLLGHVDDGVASFKRSMGGEERTFVEGTDSALLLAAARSAVFRLRALRAAVLSRRGSHAEPAASVGSITSGTAES